MSDAFIKLITFDLDNTLWDVEPALLAAEQAQHEWLQQHRPNVTEQFDAEAMRNLRFEFHQRNPQLTHQISQVRIQALEELQLQCGYTSVDAKQGAEAAFAVFLELRHAVRPYEEALEVLQTLSARYQIGALTNGNADIFKLDIGDHFDFSFSAEQFDASKPLPDLFHASMEHAGVRADQVVHVGDNPEHDVRGAQAVGMHTVWMNSGDWRWPEHRQPADADIKSLLQLPAAIARIESRLQAL